MSMNSSSLTVLGFLLLSAPALAGDAYSFTIDRNGDTAELHAGKFVLDPGRARGTVLLDESKYRLELAPDPESAQPLDAVISKDGGAHETALNLKDHTYFEAKTPGVTSPLLLLLPIGDRSASGVTTTASVQPEAVAGAPAQRHEIKLSYDITLVIPPPANMPSGFKGKAETVRGKVSIDAVYWMAEGKAPVLPRILRPEIHTGFPEIDAKLDGALAALQGIPVKQQVTITTTGDQGTEARTSTRTVTLENHKKRETKAMLFEIPAGFKMHEPEISGPGMRIVPD
ncbi:MAG TPA: hypothetical protein VFR03_17405 [Thermoanaerobaculia bacterium]|nr:hypothetical protein [Thermoanaerobaculia bacterium]